MDDGSPFLNVTETARLLGVHPNTVRNWVAAGVLVSSRLPGTKQNRFAREEVMRLVESRGAAASSIAPLLRTDEPELASALRLAEWAAHDDAKGAFPELMRRLLSQTPGVTNIDIRAHEGVAAAGWDGSATSSGTPYLPAGELRFEFGTEKDSKRKAQSDYDKRVSALPTDKDAVFVFATPRSWAGGRGWAAERADDEQFAGVKVIDAHVLEGWLHETPPVHYWISERLGFRPRDAQTLARWWESFQARVIPAIPPAFFAAGRASQVKELHSSLTGAGSGEAIAAVRAPWRDEALAFVYAALAAEPALANRAVVVTDQAAWSRLVASGQPMILIPQFENANLKAAEDGGHRVILVAGLDEPVRRGKAIELPKVDRTAARQALAGLGLESDSAESIVAMARRSTPAMFRSLARDPRTAPDWSLDERTSAILAPLVLAGSWEASVGDGELLRELTGVDVDEIQRLLKSLARRADAPFVVSGGLWRLASPEEAAFLLLRDIDPEVLDRWADLVLQALLVEDPREGMGTVERMTAEAKGVAPVYSSTLRKHLAHGLALAAVTSADLPDHLHLQTRADRIVRRLLDAASADESGATWARLSEHLPSLAEASPEALQDAIEADLARPRPLLTTLFRDSDGDGDPFGPSSPHPSLLWALETLCWAPEHFGRAAMLLAKLAAIDPGGRLSNRPLESLANVTSGWIAHSGATTRDKLDVIKRALQIAPGVGWSLLMELWPGGHKMISVPPRATYRDWAPPSQPVTYSDWGLFVHELVERAIAAADDSADRWSQLVPKFDDVPPGERKALTDTFQRVAGRSSWGADERYRVWEALDTEITRHEAHPTADWVMKPDALQTLKDLAAALEPTHDPRRHSNLFGWRAPVPGLRLGDSGYDEALSALQRQAIEDVLASGMSELESLIVDVKQPHTVGVHLAQIPAAPEGSIVAWLDSDSSNLRDAATAYARLKIYDNGIDWLQSVLGQKNHLSDQARTLLMAAVPFEKRFWIPVEDMDIELRSAYWNRVAYYGVPKAERVEGVDKLLENARPWQALGLLSGMLHDKQTLETDLIKRALRGVLGFRGPIDERQMSGYYVETLLEYLEATAPDDSDLPQLELLFFRLLHDHQPSGALYRMLSADADQFVDLVKLAFRAEGEPKRKLTEKDQAFAGLAWSVLHEWSLLPGQRPDSTIDGQHLAGWVRSARLALADAGRASIGDELIGQVLASSPAGQDGVWPAEEVRDVIENLLNARIEAGLQIGRTNQRGVTSRGVYDGGDQERALENDYREMASRIATRWPRTARLLRDIADHYKGEAAFHDADAERWGDQG